MQDAELRTILLHFFEDFHEQSESFVQDLETAQENPEAKDKLFDALQGQLKYLQHLQKATKAVLLAIGQDEALAQQEQVQLASRVDTSERSTVSSPTGNDLPPLAPREQELVTAFNEQPGQWIRRFRSTSFGAENVNEIWGKGGEPRFARKEGGIYQLIEDGDICYVFPEPGLRLQESYKRSEGLDQLFQVNVDLREGEPDIALISPAKLEESGGRWNVLSKGEIRGR